MRRKPRSIRSKIVLALLVPVLALTGLWVIDVKASFADATALPQILQLFVKQRVGRRHALR